MTRTKWFETRRQAKAYIAKDGKRPYTSEIFLWKFTKRNKRYFVGTYLEYMNIG